MPLATIGVFLLWFGWYGFNGGSVLSTDLGSVSFVFLTTSLAGAAGILGAMLTSIAVLRNLDLTMMLKGAFAGLVGITAGTDQMGAFEAAIIGPIAGALVVAAVLTIDRLKVDDPVGEISVHRVCGMWGTRAVGIHGNLASREQLVSHLVGIACYGIFTVAFPVAVFGTLKATIGLRSAEDVERSGLDRHEHGISAYLGARGLGHGGHNKPGNEFHLDEAS